MTNKYLEKIAITRLVKELARGTVTKDLRFLHGKGFIRSPEVYGEGMAKGNANLAAKLGAHIQTPRTAWDKLKTDMGGGYTAKPISKNKFKVFHSGGNSKDVTHQGMIRHELFEVEDLKKVMHEPARKFKLDDHATNMLKEHMGHTYNQKHIDKNKFFKADAFTRDGELVGMHMTPRVLTRESEMVRKNPYLEQLKGIRNEYSKESDVVKSITGKTYGVDKMTGKDHKKAFKASYTAEQNPFPSAHARHGT